MLVSTKRNGYVQLASILSSHGFDIVGFSTAQAIVRHVNFQQIKCLLLGSPGFVKDDFFEFLNLEAVRREERVSHNNGDWVDTGKVAVLLYYCIYSSSFVAVGALCLAHSYVQASE